MGRTLRVGAVGLAVLGLVACSSADDGGATKRTTTTTRPSVEVDPDLVESGPLRACAEERPEGGRTVVELESGGRTRSYVRYIPDALDASPAPVVIDFTAYSPASLEESFSGFTKPDADGKVKADEVGAIVLTPEPVNGEGLLTWNVDHTKGWADDQQFVTDMLDDIATDACTDPHRVLAMGFAIGAVMASTVACEQPERITVLATVSGLWDPPGCDPSEPTPVISFHGDDDHFLPFDGGVGDRVGRLSLSGPTSTGLVAMASRPGAVASSAAWAERNGCEREREGGMSYPGVTVQLWQGCTEPVELDVLGGGGHTWPGSNGMADYEGLLGPIFPNLDANDAIWAFFEANS